MITEQALTLVIDGQTIPLGLDSKEPLVRAVMISLFTWRRANPDDELPEPSGSAQRMGWWGDNFPTVANDRIGSRLWLLGRAKIIPETLIRAKAYAEEALKWLVDDGIAARVVVEVERQGLTTVALACRFYKTDGRVLADIRFADTWSFLQ